MTESSVIGAVEYGGEGAPRSAGLAPGRACAALRARGAGGDVRRLRPGDAEALMRRRSSASCWSCLSAAPARRRGKPGGDAAIRPTGRCASSTGRRSTPSTRGSWTRALRTRGASSPSSTRWTAPPRSGSAASAGAASSRGRPTATTAWSWSSAGASPPGASGRTPAGTAASSSTARGRTGTPARTGTAPWMRSVEAQVIEGGVGDFILVGGFDPGGRKVQPRLTVRAGKDRDGEPVFDPEAEPREFASGRINWFGRDPDWQDRLGFRGKAGRREPLRRVDPARGDRGRRPDHERRERAGS